MLKNVAHKILHRNYLNTVSSIANRFKDISIQVFLFKYVELFCIEFVCFYNLADFKSSRYLQQTEMCTLPPTKIAMAGIYRTLNQCKLSLVVTSKLHFIIRCKAFPLWKPPLYHFKLKNGPWQQS